MINISLDGQDLKLKFEGVEPSKELIDFLKRNKSELVSLLGELSKVEQCTTESELEKIWLKITGVKPNKDSELITQVTRSLDILSFKKNVFDVFEVDIPVSELYSNSKFSSILSYIKTESEKDIRYEKKYNYRVELEILAKKFNVLGGQIAAFTNGKSKSQTFGMSHYESETPFNSQESFRVVCLSKVLITYTALRLVDKGLFKLDIPINEWSLCPVELNPSLTLRHLLSHSSGFDESCTLKVNRTSKSIEEFVSHLPSYSYMFDPGEVYIYSPASILLVAHLIELHTGCKWMEIINDEVFEPLSIDPTQAQQQRAKSYTRSAESKGFKQEVKPKEIELWEAASSTNIFLTAEDILKLAVVPINKGKSIDGQQFLSANLASELITKQISLSGNYFISGFALGWVAFATEGVFGFLTGGAGQHNCVIIDSNKSTSFVIQTNTYPNFEFFNEVSKTFNGFPILKEPSTSPFSLDSAVGVYQSEGIKTTVYKEGQEYKVRVIYKLGYDEWSEPATATLYESGMGDYFANPKIYPLQDSISFHDYDNSGAVTHIRMTQKLCKKIKG